MMIKVPLKQGCIGFNNLIILKKNIKIVAFPSYSQQRKMSLHVCGRVASAVGLELNCPSDNCSALTKTDPPTFIQK